MPTTHGEQVVLRIMHRAVSKPDLGELGMTDAGREHFERAIRQPYGGVVVCGPTGSGKTTTLYTALHVLNDPGHVIMTIEDPVEYQIRGINQIEISPKSGLTFARGLRTILRSDPDVLLVGEIRDEETARIAMQAGMTGHLVLTTVHAHNAASAVERLKDMGVDPGLLASSVNCIVAQRLARRLCTDCREPYWPSDEELAAAGLAEQKGKVYLHRSSGCGRCGGTGFSGPRRALRGAARHGRDPGPRRRLDGRDLRGRGSQRHEDAAPGRGAALPRGCLVARRDPSCHRR
jgi:type II secretory ATPase GspE/PulE/Tfp pilus assembly ATPase PilB-like protein